MSSTTIPSRRSLNTFILGWDILIFGSSLRLTIMLCPVNRGGEYTFGATTATRFSSDRIVTYWCQGSTPGLTILDGHINKSAPLRVRILEASGKSTS